jgi:primary-amine oxidase
LQATSVIRKLVKETSAGSGAEIRFKSILLSEPPKALLLPYLNAEAAGASSSERVFVPRCLSLIWSLDNDVTVTESIVSLDANKEVSRSGTAKGQHGPIDRGENKLAMGAILSDPQVLAAIKKLHLPEDAIVQADTWMYGTDRDSDLDTHKFIQALLYARAPNNHSDSNQYAFPLPFSPVFDLFLGKVVRIDDLATGGKEDGLAYHTASENPMEHCVANEYHHDLHTTAPRSDLKPLRVVQPEGPSFKVSDGNCVEWQKWRFRVGFNYREGMTIHDVRYAGRPVFYRLSVSEMTVPYGGMPPIPPAQFSKP